MSQAPPAAAGRGLLLIAAAVVIGLLLLSQGFDDNAASSNESSTDEASIETTVSTDTIPTTTLAPPVDPSTVPVVVSNASGISGLAGNVTSQLEALGYITAEPETSETPSDFTSVFYLPNFEPEGRAIAEQLGLPVDQVVQPSPETPPAGDPALQVVFVIIGADFETITSGGTTDSTDTTGATDTTAATDDTLLAPG